MTNITTNLTKITPSLAKDFLQFLYKNQRPINKLHVGFLANAMKEGLFDPTSNIAFAILNGNKILIDGQHTLEAIIVSDTTQKLLVSSYGVNTENQIARLYSHFNIGKSRTFHDSVRAYGVTDRLGLTATQINKTAAAIRYQMAGFPRTRINQKYQHEYMIKKVEDWLDPALIFFNTLGNGSCNHTVRVRMGSAPVLAVCLNIVKYCPKKGVEFVSLAHDDGLKKGDPRKAFLNYITQVSQHTVTGLRPQSQGHIARATAKCWGKFFDELTLNRIRINNLDASKNIVIKGTPYTGKFSIVG